MDHMISEIERALNVRLYYLAIATALQIPDICAGLESSDGKTHPTKYKTWYSAWVASKYPQITAVDIYSLRCGVLHQGKFGHPKSQYDRIAFIVDARSPYFNMHNTIFKNPIGQPGISVLVLNPVTFCRDMIASVRDWRTAKAHDAIVLKNFQQLVEYRGGGIPHCLVGTPVIM